MPQKFIQHDGSGGLAEVQATASGGAGQEDKIPALNASGRLSETMMPTGVGAETTVVVADGALAAGDFINVYNDAGTAKARKADASSSVAPANGFVLEGYADLANAVVYWGGLNDQVTGATPGPVYLATTAGGSTGTIPSASGQTVQKIGTAVSANVIFFAPKDPILLA